MRILSQIERRRRYRHWVQAFQIGMVLFFADQIVKTYSATRLEMGSQTPLLGQSVIKLARIPDKGVANQDHQTPFYVGLALWLGVGLFLVARLRRAGSGELIGFSVVLSGGLSNLLSRAFPSQAIDTFVLQLGARRFLAFNIADACVLIASFFLIRSLLLRNRYRFGGLRFSRHSI